MEAFFTLMLVWMIVYLATRKSSSRRGMSQYEKDRIRHANKRFIEEEKQQNRKIKKELYNLLWGSNKYLLIASLMLASVLSSCKYEVGLFFIH